MTFKPIIWLYATTLAMGALLLFSVQPLVGRLVQPTLGGTPAAWTTIMLFFQGLVVAGYLYAHLSTRLLTPRRQALIHLGLALIGLVFLPVAWDPSSLVMGSSLPALGLVFALIVAIGWPLLIVATTAPLLQYWLSTLAHEESDDPYFLYAASNAGSLLALVAYPLLIDPLLGLQFQSQLWLAGYLVLLAQLALCATWLWRMPARSPRPTKAAASPPSSTEVTWKRRLRWVAWAFIPSTLFLSVTELVTTDIAPAPLLWIPPLAIYTLSFMLAFSRHFQRLQSRSLTLAPSAIVGAALLWLLDITDPLGLVVGLHMLLLFVLALAFHGLLADDRPKTTDLTGYYIWLAVGGLFGGIFNAVMAPLLFNDLWEFPLGLAVAALLLPTTLFAQLWGHRIAAAALSLAVVIVAFERWPMPLEMPSSALAAGFLVAALSALVAMHRHRRWAPVILYLMVIAALLWTIPADDDVLHRERSFHGVHEVVEDERLKAHLLYHGRTVHGAQLQGEEAEELPLTYYGEIGPLGQFFDGLESRGDRGPLAGIGLGVGTLAAYRASSEPLDFYEIDPTVTRIASNPQWFSHLQRCADSCRVISGDGRLRIQEAPPGHYEAIVLDAYSSAAIPTHLLTREAMATYFRALRPDGLLAIHISSPYLDMEPVLTATAESLGLRTLYQSHHIERDDPAYEIYIDSSAWLLVARSDDDFLPWIGDDRWQALSADPGVVPWTDDHTNLLDALLR